MLVFIIYPLILNIFFFFFLHFLLHFYTIDSKKKIEKKKKNYRLIFLQFLFYELNFSEKNIKFRKNKNKN